MSALWRWLQRLEEGLLVALVYALLLAAFAQIILRNLFSVTLLWAEPLIRLLVLWSGLIGALIATRERKHIRIDALQRLCSPAQRRLLETFSGLFSALICLLLAWIAVRFVADEKNFGTDAFLGIDTWKLQLVFPLAFGLMGLRFLFQSLRDFTSPAEDA